MPSSAVLALPIALAGLGPLAGVGVVLAVLALKLVTMSALLEAASRSSAYRLRGGGHGGVARQLLGRSGVLALVGSSALYRALSLLGALVALAGIAHDLWGVSVALVPPAVVAAVAADFAWRRRVNVGLTGSLLAVGSAAVAVVAVAGASSMDLGRWFVLGSWGPAIVGAVLTGFVAEAYVLDVVARDDPHHARQPRGALLGVVLVGGLASAWVLVVSALVPGDVLAATDGSVAGAVEGRAGVVAVAVTIGLCVLVSVTNALRNVPSLGLQVREWLPQPRRQEVGVRLGIDRLAVPGAHGAVLGATLLGHDGGGLDVWVELQRPDDLVAGAARLSADGSVVEVAAAVAEAGPALGGLRLVVLHQEGDQVVVSALAPRAGPVEVQVRPSPLRVATAVLDEGPGAAVSRALLRRPGSTATELAAATGLADPVVEAHLGALRRDGALTQQVGDGAIRYRLRLGARGRTGRGAAAGAALDALAGSPRAGGPAGIDAHVVPGPATARQVGKGQADEEAGGAGRHAVGRRPRDLLHRPAVALLVTLVPGAVVAAAAAGLLVAGAVDLAGLYGVSGVLTVAAFGVALPLLLAVAARRRGDLPRPIPAGILDATALRALGLAAVAAVLVAHATLVWTSWWARAAAALVLAGLVGVVVRSWREGRFGSTPTLVVLDDRHRGSLHLWSQRRGEIWPTHLDAGELGVVEAGGELILGAAAVPLLRLALPSGSTGVPAVTVTCLRRLPDGTVGPLGVTVLAGAHRFDVALLGGRAEVPVTGCDHLLIAPPGLGPDPVDGPEPASTGPS
jgi:DNA-binding transcriptional ArsR family regulator